MQKEKTELITILCPVHNEEAAIPIFLKRLQDSIYPLKNQYNFEIVFINDGSTDRTMELIKKECDLNEMVQLISLSRNFGYHPAVLAGLQHSSGIAIITIAADCEDPPELIPDFIATWKQGYDIVYGIRGNRPEPFLINFGRKLFYKLSNLIADSDFVPYMGEYAVITNRVRDVILANQSTFITIRSDIAYAGFSRQAIPYKSQPRVSGKTHYNFWGMIRLAISNILTTSTFPLRLAAYIGTPLFLLNWIVMTISPIIGKSFLPGWLIALNLNYLIMMSVFVSVYLARIYKDVMNKPKFIIDWENTKLNTLSSTITEPQSADGMQTEI